MPSCAGAFSQAGVPGAEPPEFWRKPGITSSLRREAGVITNANFRYFSGVDRNQPP
jgi:hypothetical protein